MNNIPTFTPPQQHVDACYFHKSEEAVTRCARCGKKICRDCAENYTVAIGKYKDQPLCYDCCKLIVEDNVVQLKKNRRSILFTFISALIGMLIVGLIFSSSEDLKDYTFFGVCIGGCLWVFIRNWFLRIVAACKGSDGLLNFFIRLLVGVILGLIIEAVCSVWRTGKKIVLSIIYLIKTSGFIKSDERSLRIMADYMEYTLVRNNNQGVDLGSLMAEGGQLQHNSFARSVATQGEEAAEGLVRNSVMSINANGEIIRSFTA